MVREWEEFPVGPDSGEDSLHVTLSKKGEITYWGEGVCTVG